MAERISRAEALLEPELHIVVDDVIEDLFWWGMAQEGRISKEHAAKAIERLKTYGDEFPVEKLEVANQMIRNLDKYGVPCLAWLP